MPRPTKQSARKPTSARQRIATALIYERLDIEGEWTDPDFVISLPTKLPPNKGHRLSNSDVREIESGLDRLVAAGCHRSALYWCLDRLGGEAEAARQGMKVTRHVDEDENSTRIVTSDPAMATREDMMGVVNKVSTAFKAIKKYRDELLLVANSNDQIELPEGMFIQVEMAEEALLLLFSSLSWVRKLASAWESPNPKALMKGKGSLFLLVYASLHCSSSQNTRRLATNAAQTIAEISTVYAGVENMAADLNDKLQDFATNEPQVFADLLALMKTIDQAASRTHTKLQPLRTT